MKHFFACFQKNSFEVEKFVSLKLSKQIPRKKCQSTIVRSADRLPEVKDGVMINQEYREYFLLWEAPSNSVVLVEHTPVYATVMRFMDYSNVVDRLKNLGADFVRTKRGGMITHHGLVAYPVLCNREQQKEGLAGH